MQRLIEYARSRYFSTRELDVDGEPVIVGGDERAIVRIAELLERAELRDEVRDGGVEVALRRRDPGMPEE